MPLTPHPLHCCYRSLNPLNECRPFLKSGSLANLIRRLHAGADLLEIDGQKLLPEILNGTEVGDMGHRVHVPILAPKVERLDIVVLVRIRRMEGALAE